MDESTWFCTMKLTCARFWKVSQNHGFNFFSFLFFANHTCLKLQNSCLTWGKYYPSVSGSFLFYSLTYYFICNIVSETEEFRHSLGQFFFPFIMKNIGNWSPKGLSKICNWFLWGQLKVNHYVKLILLVSNLNWAWINSSWWMTARNFLSRVREFNFYTLEDLKTALIQQGVYWVQVSAKSFWESRNLTRYISNLQKASESIG